MAREVSVIEARTTRDCETLRLLFLEYADSLGVALDFQGFAEELASLPGKYQPPRGEALIALVDGEPAGCVAMRPLSEDVVELKRLYVRPEYRGLGLGRRLSRSILIRATEAGYSLARLDTLSHMTAAIALYHSLGFAECGAYYDNPLPGALYMERSLGQAD